MGIIRFPVLSVRSRQGSSMAARIVSLMWDYFTAVTRDLAKCKTCDKEISTKGGSTSGLKKHLHKHKQLFEEYSLNQAERDRVSGTFLKPAKKREADEQINKPTKQMKLDFGKETHEEKQKEFDDSLVYLVAEAGVSFNVIGTPAFKNMIQIANRKLKVKTPKTISKHVEGASRNVMSDVHDIIAAVKSTVPSIGFTTDLWTSRAQDSYISLTTSFIDLDFELHRWCPFVKPFPARHTGINISLGLDRMIESLGLHEGKRKLWSVNDNAGNMKVAIRESEYLTEYNCTIHTIQLAIHDTFKDVPGMKTVLKKSKKLAKHAHTGIAMGDLRKAVESSGLKFKKPKNPGETRWDSQYDNMVSILPYKDVINNLCMNNPEWENRGLSAQEWKLLEGACVNLKHIKETVKSLEGEKEPTINKVIERLYVNHQLLDRFIADPRHVRERYGPYLK